MCGNPKPSPGVPPGENSRTFISASIVAPAWMTTWAGCLPAAGLTDLTFLRLVMSTSITFGPSASVTVSGDQPCLIPHARTLYPAPAAQLHTRTTSSSDLGTHVHTLGTMV